MTCYLDKVMHRLRNLFRHAGPRGNHLPTFRSGGHLVNVSDRNELYDAMETPQEIAARIRGRLAGRQHSDSTALVAKDRKP